MPLLDFYEIHALTRLFKSEFVTLRVVSGSKYVRYNFNALELRYLVPPSPLLLWSTKKSGILHPNVVVICTLYMYPSDKGIKYTTAQTTYQDGPTTWWMLR